MHRSLTIAGIASALLVMAACGDSTGVTSDLTVDQTTSSGRPGADVSELPTAPSPSSPTPTSTTVAPATTAATTTTALPSISTDTAFGKDESMLTDQGKQDLARMLEKLGACPPTILLIGHTDWEGSEEHNLELSTQRASAVGTWFHEHCPATKVTIDPRGEQGAHPAGATPEEMASDRRVDVTIPPV
jgi:OOP family OmpA-OmpF porin